MTDENGWNIWYENKDVIAEETEMCECVVTNKTDHNVYLIFNRDAPLGENIVHAHESIYITNKDLIRRIKAKEMQTFHFITESFERKEK